MNINPKNRSFAAVRSPSHTFHAIFKNRIKISIHSTYSVHSVNKNKVYLLAIDQRKRSWVGRVRQARISIKTVNAVEE
jgi:hypothetical protein